eukprot:s125_g40.t1
MSSDCVSLLFRDDDARHLFSWRARAYPTLERWWVLKLIDQILELTGNRTCDFMQICRRSVQDAGRKVSVRGRTIVASATRRRRRLRFALSVTSLELWSAHAQELHGRGRKSNLQAPMALLLQPGYSRRPVRRAWVIEAALLTAAALLIMGAAPEARAFVQPVSAGSMLKTPVQGLQSWSPQVASPTPSVRGSSSCAFGVAGFSLLLIYAMLRQQASAARVAQPRVVLAAMPSEMIPARSPTPCNAEPKPALPLPSPSVCAKETLMDKDMVFEEHWQLELAPARGTCAQLVLFRCLLCEEVASVKSPVPAYSPTPVARLTSAALNASTESTADGPSSVPGHQARFVGGARRTAHHSTRRRPSPRTTCRASVKLTSLEDSNRLEHHLERELAACSRIPYSRGQQGHLHQHGFPSSRKRSRRTHLNMRRFQHHLLTVGALCQSSSALSGASATQCHKILANADVADLSAASSKNTEEFADVLPGAQLGATAVDPELHKGFPRWVYMDSSAGDMIHLGYALTHRAVSMHDLASGEDGAFLETLLRRRPNVFIKVCEKALQEMCRELELQKDPSRKAPIQQLNIAVNTNLDGTAGTQKPKLIRELRHDQVEKLVVIQGICTAVRTPRSKVRRVVLRCTNCENVEEVYIEGGFTAAHIPAACKGNALRAGNLERCPPNSFVADASLSEYAADQRVRLQELPEHVPVGEMPRSIDLCAQMYDVDLCTPGTRLTCVGVFNASEKAAGDKLTRGRNQGTNTVKYSYVQVLGLQRAQGNRSQGALEISADEEERFEQLAKDPGIREKIFQSIAPAICATEKDVVNDVKRAVACLLFGGSRKFLPSGNRIRGDINVLLLGDPGTAKSQILKFGEKAAPISVYTSGKGSSAAGLTAAIVKEKNGFALEGGAMVLADGGIVCIDEFDKMDAKDRVAIHEAMEQQTISISKAGITTMLNTRCSVLAAANPRFGSYDEMAGAADQMDFETTILTRFDMMFLVKDIRDEEKDYTLAMHLIGLHNEGKQEESKAPFSVQDLRKYIAYCRSKCSPRLKPEAKEVLINHYLTIRKKIKEDSQAVVPITVRQLEAIVRISESLAKMELQQDADIGHVEEALRMFTVSTLDSANPDGQRQAGLDTMNEDDMKALQEAEEVIRRLIPHGGRKNKFTLEKDMVSRGEVPEQVARRAIHIMTRRGELEEKAHNTLRRASCFLLPASLASVISRVGFLRVLPWLQSEGKCVSLFYSGAYAQKRLVWLPMASSTLIRLSGASLFLK